MSRAAVNGGRPSRRDLKVLIVGAGFGGIAAAIELRRHGFTDITILEQAPDLGGTWFYNSYPGAACDVPSHLYSFSFAQRRDWSRLCSPQAEIHAYLHDVASAQQLDHLIHTDTTVTACSWQDSSCSWSVQTARGVSYEADALILATGQLHQPSRPPIEGAETFAGHSFHSANWDHAYALAGKRVAVIGTGASAVQFVPEIAPTVKRLSVFQRTANWFLPRENRPYPSAFKAAVELIPGLQALRRRFVFQYTESLTLSIRHPETVGRLAGARSAAFMRSQLQDPEIRAKAWPDYTFGCKRILFSSRYLPTLQRPNVELVTDAIVRMTPSGIITAASIPASSSASSREAEMDDDAPPQGSGCARDLDCVIWATGFQTNDFMFPMQIAGRDGLHLHDYWSQGAHAHLGMCVPGFPNMFVMYGPNTNTSGGSIIVYLEAQAAYLRQALTHVRARGASAIEVRAEVEAASDRELQARFAGTAWTRCDSWYRDERGRIVANWPGYMREYLARTARLDAGEYRFAALPQRTPLAHA